MKYEVLELIVADPKQREYNDRTAYELTALAAAHFSRYGFEYGALPKLRDAFLEVLSR